MKKKKILFASLDKEIDFEIKTWAHSALGRLFVFLIAFFVFLKKIFIKNPAVNFYFFDGISDKCDQIKNGAMSWRALDIIYNYQFGSDNKWTDLWLKIRNACAVRNRLKLVKYLMRSNIKSLLNKKKQIKIISIASGSAQGIIELMGELKTEGAVIQSLLIDKDESAHGYAKRLSSDYGVADQIKYCDEKASFIEHASIFFKPNIVEMVGFLEYRNDEKTIKLINSIYNALESGGMFITSQILPNAESFFMKEVINWSMIYRSGFEFEKIITQTDFKNNYKFYREPLGLHFVIECKKS